MLGPTDKQPEINHLICKTIPLTLQKPNIPTS